MNDMKRNILKILNTLIIVSLVFAWNTANAVTLDQPIDIDDSACQPVMLMSNAGEDETTGVDPIHPAWAASIGGADWVWTENPIADAVGETTEVFSRAFSLSGTPSSATLEIAADNTYRVSLNGNMPFVVDGNGDNFSGVDEGEVPLEQLIVGDNVIEFSVTNLAQENGTMESNPAGLMYKLSIECDQSDGESTCEQGEQGCGQDDEDAACPIVFARVNFSKISNGAAVNGWRNWNPGGDLVPQTFVGGSSAGDTYADEAWFPLTNPDGSSIIDSDLAAYADVPGVAVQRLDGKIRFVLYGQHDAANDEVGGKEFAAGSIELDGATWQAGMQSPLDWSNLNTNPRTHDAVINDPAYPMDSRGAFTGVINQYDYRFDRMRTWAPQKVAFHLVVTTGSDGFYAAYTANDPCDGTPEDPECTENCDPVCETQEPCDQDPTCEVACDPECTENCEPVCETECEPVCIEQCEPVCEVDCDEPGDPSCEETESCDTDDTPSGGGSSSSGSRRSSGGGGSGGEVLGAETVNICEFDIDTYMRFGYKNDPGQVATLQALLNKYADPVTPIAVDGYFGPATEALVRAFQRKYSSTILSPWNIGAPTGIFFRTTLAQAKNLECPEEPVPIPTNLINWSMSGPMVPGKI